jgi:hypothetical protein
MESAQGQAGPTVVVVELVAFLAGSSVAHVRRALTQGGPLRVAGKSGGLYATWRVRLLAVGRCTRILWSRQALGGHHKMPHSST